jgi:catechol 2,3-dioxygenase-like lactoylglutathione lyase family enzyme
MMSRRIVHALAALLALACGGLPTAFAADEARAGPIRTFTVATQALEESRLFYVTGLGLTMEGPVEVPASVKSAQRNLWQVPPAIDWQQYNLVREGVPGAAGIRLLVLDRPTPSARPSWSPAVPGPYTIGFPNTRQEQLDAELRRLGFGALNAMERSPFVSDDGRRYEILETVHTGPDFVSAVGVARGAGEPPITPVDAQGMGGPGYSMMVVDDVDAMVSFMTDVIGYELKSRRVWKSTGTRGAMNVPDGTEFDFAQLVSPEAAHGFLICIRFRNLETTPATVPPRLPARGLVMYTLPVADLDATLERARRARLDGIRGPFEIDAPGTGNHRYATLVAPNGAMFELFE